MSVKELVEVPLSATNQLPHPPHKNESEPKMSILSWLTSTPDLPNSNAALLPAYFQVPQDTQKANLSLCEPVARPPTPHPRHIPSSATQLLTTLHHYSVPTQSTHTHTHPYTYAYRSFPFLNGILQFYLWP
jgi:hypothetical protein